MLEETPSLHHFQIQRSTIANEALICESMNMPTESSETQSSKTQSSETHVVGLLTGDVPVPPWRKNHRILIRLKRIYNF
jgi:hypothetical protein